MNSKTLYNLWFTPWYLIENSVQWMVNSRRDQSTYVLVLSVSPDLRLCLHCKLYTVHCTACSVRRLTYIIMLLYNHIDVKVQLLSSYISYNIHISYIYKRKEWIWNREYSFSTFYILHSTFYVHNLSLLFVQNSTARKTTLWFTTMVLRLRLFNGKMTIYAGGGK